MEISLADIAAMISRRWAIVAFCCLFGTLSAAALAFLMTPVFRAQTVVLPVATEGVGLGLASLAGQLGALGGLELGGNSGGSRRDAWIATLKSRGTLRTFINSHALMHELFSDRWDEASGQWRTSKFPPAGEPTLDDAVVYLEQKIMTVTEDRRTGLVTIAFEWHDPDLAARWANQLVEMTNALLRRRVIEESERNIEFLEEELAKTSVIERQQIVYRLIESRTSEIMVANGRPEYAFSIIDSATPPDRDKFVRPRRVLMIVVGFVIGLFLGTILAVMRESRVRSGGT